MSGPSLGARLLPRRTWLGDVLRRWRRRRALAPSDRPLERIVDAYAASHPRTRFVQVGSNDGVRFDPITTHVRARPWTGVMVEPLPGVFERLEVTFGDHRRVRLANVAVADHDGSQTIYYLPDAEDRSALPDWYDALGSFRREVLLSHRSVIPDIEKRIAEVDVPCLTFASLCERYGVEAIDLLHIDTEGYDLEILKLVDLDRWAPDLILFEHLHLTEEDRAEARRRLEGAGFRLLSDLMDTIAVHERLLSGSGPVPVAWASAAASVGDDGLVPWSLSASDSEAGAG